MTMLTTHQAKKAHTCSYGRGCTITPGEVYVDEVLAPWELIADDVDDDGRTISSPAGEWIHVRYHGRCRDEVEWR